MPTQRYWTDEKIEQALRMIADALGYMPGKEQCDEAMGTAGLTGAIQRTGGIYKWAERLGMERPHTHIIQCMDCKRDMTVPLHVMKTRCPECRKAYKAQYQKDNYTSKAMTKPIDSTTDMIIVRAMDGRRKQSESDVAQDLKRDESEISKRVKWLKSTGQWDKIRRSLHIRDTTYDRSLTVAEVIK